MANENKTPVFDIISRAGPPPVVRRVLPIAPAAAPAPTPVVITARTKLPSLKKSVTKPLPIESKSQYIDITTMAGPPPVITRRAPAPRPSTIITKAPTPRPTTPITKAPAPAPAPAPATAAPAAPKPRPRLIPPTPTAPPPPPVAAKPAPPVAAKPPKFIGEGSYGCVYSPPLQCSDPCVDERCKTGISKLMHVNDALKEQSEYTRNNLDDLDPESKYYFKKPYICDPKLPLHSNSNLPNKDGMSCTISKLEMPNKKLLIYDNGGIDLYKLYINLINYCIRNKNTEQLIINLKYILSKLQNVFDGVAKLNENNIYHFDIKVENIVTGINESNIDFKNLPTDNTFRIIDFGLANKFQNKDLAGNDSVEQLNFIRPLDIVYLSGLPVAEINDIITYEYIDPRRGLDDIRYVYYEIYGIQNHDNLSNIILDKLNSYYNNTSTEHNKNEFIEQVFRTIDTFSLGCLLIYIHATLDNANRSINGTTPNPVLQKISLKILNFVVNNHLMHYNPFERPLVNGPDGLANKYKQFLTTLYK